MSIQVMPTPYAATGIHSSSIANSFLTTNLLTTGDEQEVLDFLAERPLHTVFLAGYIHNNGLVSPINRGSFYACRDERGQLEGVALIGRATLIEARSDAALEAFARLTRNNTLGDIIMGEKEKLERFWRYYAESGETPRLVVQNMLLEQQSPDAVAHEGEPGLRVATLDDLSHIARINAAMLLECSGVDPLQTDPDGFRRRVRRRIEQGRVWVLTEDDRLIFKAEVIADTPKVIYLEGLYVNPEERGKGHALRCTAQLCRNLLERAMSVCLLVEEGNERAQRLYHRAGFQFQSCYHTFYLQRPSN